MCCFSPQAENLFCSHIPTKIVQLDSLLKVADVPTRRRLHDVIVWCKRDVIFARLYLLFPGGCAQHHGHDVPPRAPGHPHPRAPHPRGGGRWSREEEGGAESIRTLQGGRLPSDWLAGSVSQSVLKMLIHFNCCASKV